MMSDVQNVMLFKAGLMNVKQVDTPVIRLVMTQLEDQWPCHRGYDLQDPRQKGLALLNPAKSAASLTAGREHLSGLQFIQNDSVMGVLYREQACKNQAFDTGDYFPGGFSVDINDGLVINFGCLRECFSCPWQWLIQHQQHVVGA